MVIWNGPLGYVEIDNFAIGSARVALAIAQNKGVVSELVAEIRLILYWNGTDMMVPILPMFLPVAEASMALMAGKKLPGIESLLDVYGLRW